MEKYVTKILINDSWKDILVYKSATPITFDDLSNHKIVLELGNETIVTTYRTEPCIYKTYEPTDSDNNYYYWFVISTIEKDKITTYGEDVENLKNEITKLNQTSLDLTQAVVNLQFDNDMGHLGQ